MVLKKKPVTDSSRQLLLVIDEIHDISMAFIRAIYFHQQVIVRRIVAGLYEETVQEGTR